MPPGLIALLIFMFVGMAMAAVAAYALLREKQRGEEVAKFASDLGLTYEKELNAEDRRRFEHFLLAQRGRARNAFNAVVADAGDLKMTIFDYRYTVGSGKNKRVVMQTIVLARAETLSLPAFSLAPETFFHRLGDWFGKGDIDFEDDEEFSRKFLLNGPNEPAVREFFTSKRRQAFRGYERVAVEGHRDTFIFYRPAKRQAVEDIKPLMEEAFQVLGRLT